MHEIDVLLRSRPLAPGIQLVEAQREDGASGLRHSKEAATSRYCFARDLGDRQSGGSVFGLG